MKIIFAIVILLSVLLGGIGYAQEVTDKYCKDNTTLVTVYTSHWVINHRHYDINQTDYTYCEFGCYQKDDTAYCLPSPIKQKIYMTLGIAGLIIVVAYIFLVFGGRR